MSHRQHLNLRWIYTTKLYKIRSRIDPENEDRENASTHM
jgi:hypothetical protein